MTDINTPSSSTAQIHERFDAMQKEQEAKGDKISQTGKSISDAGKKAGNNYVGYAAQAVGSVTQGVGAAVKKDADPNSNTAEVLLAYQLGTLSGASGMDLNGMVDKKTADENKSPVAQESITTESNVVEPLAQLTAQNTTSPSAPSAEISAPTTATM